MSNRSNPQPGAIEGRRLRFSLSFAESLLLAEAIERHVLPRLVAQARAVDPMDEETPRRRSEIAFFQELTGRLRGDVQSASNEPS